MQRRRKQRAKLVRTNQDGMSLIQFVSGGCYWLSKNGNALFTGAKMLPATAKVTARFIELARRGRTAGGDWVN